MYVVVGVWVRVEKILLRWDGWAGRNCHPISGPPAVGGMGPVATEEEGGGSGNGKAHLSLDEADHLGVQWVPLFGK